MFEDMNLHEAKELMQGSTSLLSLLDLWLLDDLALLDNDKYLEDIYAESVQGEYNELYY